MGRYFKVIYEDNSSTTIWGESKEEVIRWLEKQHIKYRKVVELL